MKVSLSNRYLTVVTNTRGAELNSIRNENQIEYLWQANSRYWGWHAPILFPIVGRLVNNQYQFNHKTYRMHQHGFARRSQFRIIQKSLNQVTFDLKASCKTEPIYPFNFDLRVSYRLVDHTIKVNIVVLNDGHRKLWFSTGSHPGFNLPINHRGATFDDYRLTVAPKKRYQRIPLKASLNDVQDPVGIDLRRPVHLRHQMFRNDALVLSLHRRQTTLMLSTPYDNNGVAVTVYDCPFVGVWSSYPNLGPFACIEPWWGLADNVHSDGQIIHKTAINQLAPQKSFNASFDITIF